jgi:RNA polymerase sigma-70 factor, ECF subfamily
MNESEDEWIAQAKQGQREAIHAIIAIHERKVAATIAGILGQGPDVDDIGQEVFFRFFRSLNGFRGDSLIRTYLTRIAINLSLNELKRRKREARSRDSATPEKLFSFHAARAEQRAGEMKETVRLALQKLPPKFRTVIVLRLINDYSTRETAKILRLPEGTVLSRLARGQAKLKGILEGIDLSYSERNGGKHE